jgi:hypothetical protein
MGLLRVDILHDFNASEGPSHATAPASLELVARDVSVLAMEVDGIWDWSTPMRAGEDS